MHQYEIDTLRAQLMIAQENGVNVPVVIGEDLLEAEVNSTIISTDSSDQPKENQSEPTTFNVREYGGTHASKASPHEQHSNEIKFDHSIHVAAQSLGGDLLEAEANDSKMSTLVQAAEGESQRNCHNFQYCVPLVK